MNKIIWWSVGISVVLIIGVISAVSFSLLSEGETKSVESTAQGDAEAAADSSEDQSRVSKGINQFVKDEHHFYNQTLGYGGKDEIDYKKQRKEADYILEYLDQQHEYGEVQESDIEKIRKLAGLDEFVELHRMFHDLDIAVNNYTNYKKVWGVTDTLEEK
ncbi:hypothetical protein Q7A53_09445 [Halobacillus rhizosphaerae]|uniref:hypothetical protein n=1 Tax=Halobacillus rhizosphaerae TaxID=3064889 RepID=UPI00398BA89B